MLACYVNPSLPHFFGGPMKLASDTVYHVGSDGRLVPDPQGEDSDHAAAIPSLFHFVDCDDTHVDEGDTGGPSDEHPEGQPGPLAEDEPSLTDTETEKARAVLNRVLSASKPPRKTAGRKKNTDKI